jgi:subtilisin family serine protease
MRKATIFLLIAVFALAAFAAPQPAHSERSATQSKNAPAAGARLLSPPHGGKIDPEVQARLDTLSPGEMITVIVTLNQQADLDNIPGANRAARQRGVIRALQATALASQASLRAALATLQAQGKVGRVTSFWVFNGLSVTATPDVIQELAANPDVYSITLDGTNIVPATPLAYLPAEANLSLINAPALWDLGYRGQGITVASLDSGVSLDHPEIAARWRGGSNSWFDPYGQHPTSPTDLSGHGTRVMGIMVGADAGGTSIGVAPQAQWISAKIFNDQGSATATAIHQSFQWVLDPDDNPDTADAPYVVNNSWAFGGPGCNLEFQLDLQALLAINILPIFAAGNFGPNASTSVSPANYPESVAVGAINNNNSIYGYSGRGPSACGEASHIYPELVAPGVNVRTTDLGGLYTRVTGTSLAAPHAAGALALLLNAYPNLSAAQQREALISGAFDLGAAGPDNNYGYGRLDALAAYQRLQSGGSTPTPTPAPTATPTPVPATNSHVGDLDRTATPSGAKWNATVTITIHNTTESPVANATVSGKWTNGANGTASCVTNSNGVCQVAKTGLGAKASSVTFSVTNVTHATLAYNSPANHDPDGDSTGTVIVVSKP